MIKAIEIDVLIIIILKITIVSYLDYYLPIYFANVMKRKDLFPLFGVI